MVRKNTGHITVMNWRVSQGHNWLGQGFLPVAQRRGQVMLMVFQTLSFFVTFDLFNLRCQILQTDFTSSR